MIGDLSVTVVVPTHNRPRLLERCLDAVAALDYGDFDVLVVDSAPDDGSARTIAEGRGYRYVYEVFPGAARARNTGARACTTDIVAYVDDDAVPAPSWLGALVREFEDPHVGVVVGQTLAFADGDADAGAGRDYAAMAGASSSGSHRLLVNRNTPNWFELTNFGAIPGSGSLALRRSVLAEWPGFDERLGRGGPEVAAAEENYAYFSIVEVGWAVAYAPDAVVSHAYPATPIALRAYTLRQYELVTSFAIFLFLEQPAYRARLARYVLGGLRGVDRPWRGAHLRSARSQLSRWRLALAVLKGLGVGLRIVLRRSLRRVRPARSTWFLLRSLAEAATDTSRRVRGSLDREFDARRDPWGYETALDHRGRFEHHIAILDEVRGGRRFERGLEIGSAEGGLTQLLADRCDSLYAMDLSSVALARAQKRVTAANVRFHQWDLRRDELDGLFDLIVLVDVLAYVRRPRALRAIRGKLIEHLRPGGYLYMVNTREVDLFETAWWGKPLLRGGLQHERLFARHPALSTIRREVDERDVETLFQRVQP